MRGHKKTISRKNHYCGKDPHHCNEDCIYQGKARNCDNKCKLEYPHIPYVHNCKKTHLCKEYCDSKGKAKVEGCNDEEFCSLEYGHEGSHNCGKNHICKETCSKNCNNECQLLYGHTPEIHDCGAKTHLCKKEFPFFLYQEIVIKHAKETMTMVVSAYAIYKNKNIFVIKNVICLIVIIEIVF